MFWADSMAIPILGYFSYWAISQFNPEHSGTTIYVNAIGKQCFYSTLFLLFCTLLMVALSKNAQRMWSFKFFVIAFAAMLILWLPVVI
jgi:hypothetical protein